VIVIQNAEERGSETVTFWDFARVGIPLTALNVVVYLAYLALMP
jgi:Na+/H+ antiporter NhaD/arsenite permease-like protein